jgi:glycosyltransferase involved in cell wall biosynthesis
VKNGRGRLLFVCPNLEPGGAERQWAMLIPALSERGFHAEVVTLDGRGAYYEELAGRGIPIACAGLKRRTDVPGLRRALLLGGAGASAIVTRGTSAHVLGRMLASRQRAAHVVTEHLGPDPLGVRRPRRHQRFLVRPIFPRASAVVAVAASQTEPLVRQGCRRDAVRVIANGVVSDPPVRDRAALRAELDVRPETFLAVLVAPLRREKQATVFVEQVVAAHAIDPSIEGLVVGDGPEAAAVELAVARSNGTVRMTGFRPDAIDVMHAADVLCVTSAVEAQPMSVLEAMSVSRPVIANSVGGLPELVANGETGYLISPERPAQLAQVLVRLAREREHAAALGRAGRARQQRSFSVEAMVDSYADLFSAVTASERPR